jgi:hypothetical protein
MPRRLQRNFWIWHVAAFAIAVAGAAAGYAQQTRAPGEYLVTLAAPAEVKAIADVYGRFGIKGIERLGDNVFLVTLTEDPGPATMEKLRAEDARIRAVEPNLLYRSQGNRTFR